MDYQLLLYLIVEYFLKIQNIELLKRVFKDEIQKHNIEPYEDTIPFFLGQMALLLLHYKRKKWGYHTIMKFLRDKKNFELQTNDMALNLEIISNLLKKYH